VKKKFIWRLCDSILKKLVDNFLVLGILESSVVVVTVDGGLVNNERSINNG